MVEKAGINVDQMLELLVKNSGADLTTTIKMAPHESEFFKKFLVV